MGYRLIDFIIIIFICLVGGLVMFGLFKFINNFFSNKMKEKDDEQNEFTINSSVSDISDTDTTNNEQESVIAQVEDNSDIQNPRKSLSEDEKQSLKENFEKVFYAEKHEIEKSFRVIDKSVNLKTITKRINMINDHMEKINNSANLYKENNANIFEEFDKELEDLYLRISKVQEKLSSLEN